VVLPFNIVISQKSVFGEIPNVKKARNIKGFQIFIRNPQKAKSFLGRFLKGIFVFGRFLGN